MRLNINNFNFNTSSPSELPFSAKGVTGFIDLLKGNGLTPFDGALTFYDKSGTKTPFAPHYEQYVRPHVQNFEEKRIAALKVLRSRSLRAIKIAIAVIAGALFLNSSVNLGSDFNQFSFWGPIFLIGLLGMWCYSPVSKYKTAVKDQIFPNIFSFFGEDFHYSASSPRSVGSLRGSDLIPSYNNEKSEDYVKGSYKGVSLELFESRLTQEEGSGDNRRDVTVFKGIFILLSVNKSFNGKTIIKRDRGKIGNWFSKKFAKLENVVLEDPVFEKKFEVYSNDQIEARYLLTVSFMERLLELAELFGDEGIQGCFYDHNLLFMIPSSKNYFETASIFEPATFREDISTILEEMSLIFQIVDVLKLDQRTGL